MVVDVAGRDRFGDTGFKAGDLSTPSSLPASRSPRANLALLGQGVGPIFGGVVFPQGKPSLPTSALTDLYVPTAPRASKVLSSLEQVAEPTRISYGLTYGGIAGVQQVASPSTPPGQITGRFTLEGTVGGTKVTQLAAVAAPRVMANPLPGTVGLFLTGLGAGVGAIRLLGRRLRPAG
jgi:hypothetical protein